MAKEKTQNTFTRAAQAEALAQEEALEMFGQCDREYVLQALGRIIGAVAGGRVRGILKIADAAFEDNNLHGLAKIMRRLH